MESPNPNGCALVRTVPVRELVERYKKERRRPVSKTDADNIDVAFKYFYEIVDKNASTADFGGAEAIEKLQNLLIKKINKKGRPYCRKYINKLIAFIRGVFYWGAKKKLVSYTLAAELKLVSALQYGEALHENPDREAASPEAIIATIRHLEEQQFIDMVILQVLTGMRPSELCNLKAGEIRKINGIWTFVPLHHKTKWKGKPRSIALGAEEMAILEKYTTGKKADEPLFCNLHRYRNEAISTASYSTKLRKTQEKHGLEKFTPYQIRHSNGTWISEVLDRDHARAQLGHATEKTTGIYDHSDTKKQKAVIEKRKAVGSLIGDVFEFIAVPPKTPSTAAHYPHIIQFPRNNRIFTTE